MHAHTTYRNPQLAALSPEELLVLDGLTRKLALPAPNGPRKSSRFNSFRTAKRRIATRSSYSHRMSPTRAQSLSNFGQNDASSLNYNSPLSMGGSMYTIYDIFEEQPDGKMWRGVAEGRDTAIEKLQELAHQAAYPVMALNLQTRETLRWQPESAK